MYKKYLVSCMSLILAGNTLVYADSNSAKAETTAQATTTKTTTATTNAKAKETVKAEQKAADALQAQAVKMLKSSGKLGSDGDSSAPTNFASEALKNPYQFQVNPETLQLSSAINLMPHPIQAAIDGPQFNLQLISSAAQNLYNPVDDTVTYMDDNPQADNINANLNVNQFRFSHYALNIPYVSFRVEQSGDPSLRTVKKIYYIDAIHLSNGNVISLKGEGFEDGKPTGIISAEYDKDLNLKYSIKFDNGAVVYTDEEGTVYKFILKRPSVRITNDDFSDITAPLAVITSPNGKQLFFIYQDNTNARWREIPASITGFVDGKQTTLVKFDVEHNNQSASSYEKFTNYAGAFTKFDITYMGDNDTAGSPTQKTSLSFKQGGDQEGEFDFPYSAISQITYASGTSDAQSIQLNDFYIPGSCNSENKVCENVATYLGSLTNPLGAIVSFDLKDNNGLLELPIDYNNKLQDPILQHYISSMNIQLPDETEAVSTTLYHYTSQSNYMGAQGTKTIVLPLDLGSMTVGQPFNNCVGKYGDYSLESGAWHDGVDPLYACMDQGMPDYGYSTSATTLAYGQLMAHADYEFTLHHPVTVTQSVVDLSGNLFKQSETHNTYATASLFDALPVWFNNPTQTTQILYTNPQTGEPLTTITNRNYDNTTGQLLEQSTFPGRAQAEDNPLVDQLISSYRLPKQDKSGNYLDFTYAPQEQVTHYYLDPASTDPYVSEAQSNTYYDVVSAPVKTQTNTVIDLNNKLTSTTSYTYQNEDLPSLIASQTTSATKNNSLDSNNIARTNFSYNTGSNSTQISHTVTDISKYLSANAPQSLVSDKTVNPFTGHTTSEIDAQGHTTTYQYDGLGRAISKTEFAETDHPLTTSINYVIDNHQMYVTQTDPYGYHTQEVYDALGRKIEERADVVSKESVTSTHDSIALPVLLKSYDYGYDGKAALTYQQETDYLYSDKNTTPETADKKIIKAYISPFVSTQSPYYVDTYLNDKLISRQVNSANFITNDPHNANYAALVSFHYTFTPDSQGNLYVNDLGVSMQDPSLLTVESYDYKVDPDFSYTQVDTKTNTATKQPFYTDPQVVSVVKTIQADLNKALTDPKSVDYSVMLNALQGSKKLYQTAFYNTPYAHTLTLMDPLTMNEKDEKDRRSIYSYDFLTGVKTENVYQAGRLGESMVCILPNDHYADACDPATASHHLQFGYDDIGNLSSVSLVKPAS